ncbi:efflux transporter periplasmic adaptor subunit, partial [Methylobacterium frigidaeris]
MAGASYHYAPLSRLSGSQAVAATPPVEQAVPVPVAAVEPRDVVLFNEFSGRLEAVERIDVRARVGGAIAATHFSEGDLVRTG